MSELIGVRIGECQCPGAPHADGDYVYLRPKLDLRGGFRVKRRLIDLNRAAFGEDAKVEMAELEIGLAESYLSEGIFSWNLVDEEGADRPLTPETLAEFLFSDYSRAELAADKADDLYRPAVLDPLVERALSSLPDTPTNGSTSPTNGAGRKRPKRSKRSSTTTTPTGSTATTT
jgi:hypothetical protein